MSRRGNGCFEIVVLLCAATALLLLLSLVIYEARRPPVTSGVVTEKIYTAAHTDTIITPMLVGETFVYIPIDHPVPESWKLELQTVGKDGKRIIGKVAVSESQFNAAKVYDRWPPETVSLDPQP